MASRGNCWKERRGREGKEGGLAHTRERWLHLTSMKSKMQKDVYSMTHFYFNNNKKNKKAQRRSF
jgi:hypothetical protein